MTTVNNNKPGISLLVVANSPAEKAVHLDVGGVKFKLGGLGKADQPQLAVALLMPAEKDGPTVTVSVDTKPDEKTVSANLAQLEKLLPKDKVLRGKDAEANTAALVKLFNDMPPEIKREVLKQFNAANPSKASAHPLRPLNEALARVYGSKGNAVDPYLQLEMAIGKGLGNLAYPGNDLKKPLDYVGPNDAQATVMFKWLDVPPGVKPEDATKLRPVQVDTAKQFIKDFKDLTVGSAERNRMKASLLALAKDSPFFTNHPKYKAATTDEEKITAILKILEELIDARKP